MTNRQAGTQKPTVKYLTVVQGRGTPNGQRIRTRIALYQTASERWVSIPEG
jgi:hypothetical protein